jgi:hypothetical protein
MAQSRQIRRLGARCRPSPPRLSRLAIDGLFPVQFGTGQKPAKQGLTASQGAGTQQRARRGPLQRLGRAKLRVKLA